MSHLRTARRCMLGWVLSILLLGCASAPPPAADTTSQSIPNTPSPDRATKVSKHAAPADLASRLRSTAPMRYRVERNDTLWRIARTYLDEPAYWPELWQTRDTPTEPDTLYAGDTLVLSRDMNGRPRLSRDRTIRLSPKIREQPISKAVPVIPYDAIRDFLESPRFVDASSLKDAPYVVSIEDEHLIAGTGSTLYIRGVPSHGLKHYDLVHPTPSERASDSRRRLGRRVVPVGRITLDPANRTIVRATLDHAYREARPGDRLIPAANDNSLRDFYPRRPSGPITARIIAVYGGVSQIGQYDVVTLDRGTAEGLTRGDVLDIYRASQRIVDPIAGDRVALPEVEAGRLMVFKTAEHTSYGLVMHATRAIHVDDVVHAAGADLSAIDRSNGLSRSYAASGPRRSGLDTDTVLSQPSAALALGGINRPYLSVFDLSISRPKWSLFTRREPVRTP